MRALFFLAALALLIAISIGAFPDMNAGTKVILSIILIPILVKNGLYLIVRAMR